MEISGVIEAVGKSVTKFKVGDEVFAETDFGGGYAEYICLPEMPEIKSPKVVIELKKNQ